MGNLTGVNRWEERIGNEKKNSISVPWWTRSLIGKGGYILRVRTRKGIQKVVISDMNLVNIHNYFSEFLSIN